ncbi:MAG: hypothetical protein Q4G03_09510 [Planctomycetia bacterium]|nr:hypothetical protein [Planctomycetia bacterium]
MTQENLSFGDSNAQDAATEEKFEQIWDALDAQFNLPDADADCDEIQNLEPLDPDDEIILSYLDGELSDEERNNFEARLHQDASLHARLEEQRAALSALDSFDPLDSLDDPSHGVDLTEPTLSRLEKETLSEIETLERSYRQEKRRFQFIEVVCALAVLALGYISFSELFPDRDAKRARDCRVVECLTQLEAVQNFEYLVTLDDSHLMTQWRDLCRRLDAHNDANKAPMTHDKKQTEEKTYQALAQDRAFYRQQERFERLDKPTQDRWRRLYTQISNAPNAAQLRQTLDDYAQWLATSTSDAERERLGAMSIDERLDFVKMKVAETGRFVDFVANSAKTPWHKLHGSQPDANQRPNEQKELLATNELRGALPPALREENLTPLYRKYLEYSRNQPSSENPVLSFLSDLSSNTAANNNANATGDDNDVCDPNCNDPCVSCAELTNEFSDNLSQNAKDYLESLDDAERSSIIGMLLSISFVENSEQFIKERQREREERVRQQKGNQPGAFNIPRVDSLEELATTLRNAPQQSRDYITSCTPQEARGILLGATWQRFSAPPNSFPTGQPQFFNNNGQPGDPGKMRAQNAPPQPYERKDMRMPMGNEQDAKRHAPRITNH